MPQSCPESTLDVAGNEILVTLRGTSYAVTYSKRAGSPGLLAKDFIQDDDPCVTETSAEFLEFVTGNVLLDRCVSHERISERRGPLLPDDELNAGSCLGFIIGAVDAFTVDHKICPPNDMDGKQAVDIVTMRGDQPKDNKKANLWLAQVRIAHFRLNPSGHRVVSAASGCHRAPALDHQTASAGLSWLAQCSNRL